MARKRERGQVLVIFAGGLIAFLAVAALVFDVGQNLLDWRSQRNAADAAALAGARYIIDDTCVAAPSIANCPDAYNAAIEVARLNGYGDLDFDGVADRGIVTVYIPPQPGRNYAGQPKFIEVDIHTDRPSFFAAVLGVLRQNVDALAVAGNSDDIALGYSIIATDPDCPVAPLWIHGGTQATVLGDIQVNSSCDGGMTIAGNSSLDGQECNVVGTLVENGNPEQECRPLNEGAKFFQPPLIEPTPANPGPPLRVEVLAGRIYDVNGDGIGGTNPPDDLGPPIPPGCPGSANPATKENPIGCSFPGPRTLIDPVTGATILDNNGDPVPLPAQDGYDIYRIHPGAYYGGLHFSDSAPTGGTKVVQTRNGPQTVPITYDRHVRVYLSPGVYYLAGGGFTIGGKGAQVVSMDRTNVGADPYPTKGRGVLIYNDEDAFYSRACADPLDVSEPPGACIGWFHTSGGSDKWTNCSYEPPPAPLDTTKACTWLYLAADDENGDYPGLVYYQNPDLWERMVVNGDGPKIEIMGTIYVPLGEIQINGNSDDGIVAQIIAWHIDFSGTSEFTVTYDPDYLIKLKAAGLVQ